MSDWAWKARMIKGSQVLVTCARQFRSPMNLKRLLHVFIIQAETTARDARMEKHCLQ